VKTCQLFHLLAAPMPEESIFTRDRYRRLRHREFVRSGQLRTSKVNCSRARVSTPMPTRPLLTLFICSLLVQPVAAQRFNFNIGGGPAIPLSHAGDFANTSYNFVVGGGPANLAPHVKFNGEFMFHGLPLKRSVIDEAQIPSAKGRLYAVTGNLLVGGGDKKGAYVIVGGGWYRRTAEAPETKFAAGDVCAPVLQWWDAKCMNGVFPADVTIASHSSNAGGINIGAGLTVSAGKSGAHLYAEVRYHHAFTDGVDTTVLPITFGIRW
jgi:hypothetical protein